MAREKMRPVKGKSANYKVKDIGYRGPLGEANL